MAAVPWWPARAARPHRPFRHAGRSNLPAYFASLQLLFAAAATLFLTGAVGVEMFEARYVQIHGLENFGYAVFIWVEETFELVGVLAFVHGLLLLLEKLGGRIEALVVGLPEKRPIPMA